MGARGIYAFLERMSDTKMSDEKTAVRVLLRHCWKKGQSARAAAKEICDVEGEGAMSKSTAASWFKRFQDGDMSVEDRPHTGRPSELDDEALFQAVQEEPEASVRSLSDALDYHNSTIDRHLQRLGLSEKTTSRSSTRTDT